MNEKWDLVERWEDGGSWPSIIVHGGMRTRSHPWYESPSLYPQRARCLLLEPLS